MDSETKFIQKLAAVNPTFELVSHYTGGKNKVFVRCTKCGNIISRRADRFCYLVIPCPNCKNQSKRAEKSWLKWNEGYKHAEQYSKENSNLFVPYNYISEDGYKLGLWLNNQRAQYVANQLLQERIEKLNSIGMVWNKYKSLWDKSYGVILEYYSQNGSIYPLKNLGLALGDEYVKWIHTQTTERTKGKLSEGKIALLEQIDIKWNIKDAQWEEMYQMAKKYYFTHCNSDKLLFSGNEPPELHHWLRRQRANYKDGTNSNFTNDRIKKLNEIGMVWDEYEYSWFEHYQLATQYYEKNKHLTPTLEENRQLFAWIRSQRKAYKAGKLSVNKIELLEKIDMVWDDSNKVIRVSFPEKAVLFFLQSHYPSVESSNRTILGGKELDMYIPELSTAIEYDGYYHINTLEKDLEKNKLCKDRGIRLIRIREATIPKMDSSDTVCIIEQKDIGVSSLANSITQLLAILGTNQTVSAELIEQYSKEIANTVNNHNAFFEMMYQKAEAYYKDHGHLVPSTQDDKQLRQWLQNLRTRYSNCGLSDAVIKRLNDIGMEWTPVKDTWERNYKIAERYYNAHGDLKIPRSCEMEGIKIGQWIKAQRNQYAAGTISKEREEKLNEIQMIWNMNKN